MGKSWDGLSDKEKDKVYRQVGLYCPYCNLRIDRAKLRKATSERDVSHFENMIMHWEQYITEHEGSAKRAWTVSQELPKIRKAQYRLYLQSDEWRERADRVLARDSFACRICGATDNLHVHHLTYDRKYNESDYDLITVCKQCHRTIHKLK